MGSEATRKSGYDCVRRLFAQDKRPTGIACFNDLVAVGVMSGLRSMNIVPGKDVSVTGYDNIAEAEDNLTCTDHCLEWPAESGHAGCQGDDQYGAWKYTEKR